MVSRVFKKLLSYIGTVGVGVLGLLGFLSVVMLLWVVLFLFWKLICIVSVAISSPGIARTVSSWLAGIFLISLIGYWTVKFLHKVGDFILFCYRDNKSKGRK